MIRRRKVFAYITSGRRLLLLSHPNQPQAGLQTPAGTVESDDSSLSAAVLREALEETGLEGLELVGYLGEATVAVGDELHERHCFHLHYSGDSPERWRHVEQFSSGNQQPLFELFWVALPYSGPPLIGGHDRWLPDLMAHLGSGPRSAA